MSVWSSWNVLPRRGAVFSEVADGILTATVCWWGNAHPSQHTDAIWSCLSTPEVVWNRQTKTYLGHREGVGVTPIHARSISVPVGTAIRLHSCVHASPKCIHFRVRACSMPSVLPKHCSLVAQHLLLSAVKLWKLYIRAFSLYSLSIPVWVVVMPGPYLCHLHILVTVLSF